MSKKGGEFEINAIDFLEKIFTELKYTVVRKRTQKSGSQDGYDDLIEIIDSRLRSYTIYSECKDYSSHLNYTQAIEKIPHIVSTHQSIDLLLFISPYKDFSNTNENSKVESFYQAISDRCPVEFLTPESFIEDYFSLYPELFKKVYESDMDIVKGNRREEILRRFEKLIFSSKNLKRVVILAEDKEKYIGENSIREFHIVRNFRKFQENAPYIIDNHEYNLDLLDYLNSSKLGVVILGNPGYGKSEELKNFSAKLWNTMDENFKIPKFQSLKDFNTDTKIENLLPRDYRNMYDLVIIFDGLDEVHNIVDFSNKFRSFISDNAELINQRRMKFVISCRTSIYKRCVKDLKNLDICFLNEVTEGAAIRFLFKKFNLDITSAAGFSFYKYRDVLENPFYLQILGSYYKKTGDILLNKSKLIEKYVESRLELDESNKFRNDLDFDKSEILEYSKKIAIALELMQKTSMSTTEIGFICKKKIYAFKNPFLNENLENNTWSFEHKNIQEYFVAKVLSDLDFEEIIKILRIDEKSNKIHPTWINVVSFLLNLELPTQVFNKIVEWISNNDIAFIFEADHNRITDEIKIKCLQQLFEENCIKNTMWIENSSEVGTFSNVSENVRYLIDVAKNTTIHIRARISAVELLSHMSFSILQVSEIKRLIFQIIEEFENDAEGKQYLLYQSFSIIRNTDLKFDYTFYQNVFDKLKAYDNKDVVDAIFSSMPNELIDTNIDYFLNILQKSIEKKWKSASSTRNLISRKGSVFNIFKKISEPKTLLIILAFLIEIHKDSEIKRSYIENFISHLIKQFEILNDDIKDSIVLVISNAVLNDKIRYFDQNLFIDLVKALKIEKKVFDKIFNCITDKRSQKYFLAGIVENTFFKDIVNGYNNKLVNDNFIVEFREILSYDKSIDFAIEFEKFFEDNSVFRFKNKLKKEEFEKKLYSSRNERQREFECLFNSKQLENEMKVIFQFKNKEALCYEDLECFRKVFYETEFLRENVTVNAKELLIKILRKNFKKPKTLSINDLHRYIMIYEFDIISNIYRSLPTENDQYVILTPDHISFIRNWCEENTVRMNLAYSNYILTGQPWEEEDYHIFKTIYKFQRYFNFELSEELLLNLIILNSFNEDADLKFIKDHVSKNKIDQRIIENVNKTEDDSSLYFYVKYMFDNHIALTVLNFDLKQRIRDLLLSGSCYYPKKLIDLLYIGDIVFLKELTDLKYITPKMYFLDFILGLLIKNNETVFVENFLLYHYDTLISENLMEENNIIKNLILSNSDLGFKKLRELMIENPMQFVSIESHFKYDTWLQFSNTNSINDLISIFNFALLNYSSDQINRAHYSPLRISTETIINICKNQNSVICDLVLEKLEQIDENLILEKGGDLFHVNKLKRDVCEISLKHKSLPFSSKQVAKLIDDYEHLFFN
ncbi:hypothetical protein HZP16_13205 [Elizabethkingia anophelis]|nr:hypothetical protein [Elizabethkingia anophelis]